MRVGRLLLVVATLVTIVVFPLMLRDAVAALKLPSAYAAPNIADASGRVYQDGNNNDNGGNNGGDDDDNDNRNGDTENNDDDDEDNDNAVCYESLNSNEEVPCDFDDNGNNNDNYYAPAPYNPPAPSASAPAPAASDSRCFSTGETGQVVLNLSGGSVVVSVVGPGLPASSRVGLESVSDMSGIPTPPGGATMLDALIWRVTATTGCDGGSAGQVTGAVNLGIPYNVSADKSKLQIVFLQAGQWVEVPTTPDPDPNKPYISSTIQNTGIYAVIQKP